MLPRGTVEQRGRANNPGLTTGVGSIILQKPRIGRETESRVKDDRDGRGGR